VLYLILSGQTPFSANDDVETLKQIQDGSYSFEPCDVWDDVSSSAKQLIEGMLRVQPSERLPAAQAAQHEWILQNASSSADSPQKSMGLKSFSKLRSFTAWQKVKRASAQIVSRHLDEDAVKRLMDVFLERDAERCGKLRAEHLESILVEFQCSQEATLQLRKTLYSVGGSSDEVAYADIASAMQSRRAQLQAEALSNAFKMLDNDLKGHVTKKDLSDMLSWEVPLLCSGDIVRLQDIAGMSVADVENSSTLNGDGHVSNEAFQGMLAQRA
jgi:Ca2+-binding EF-hand superfamily protein